MPPLRVCSHGYFSMLTFSAWKNSTKKLSVQFLGVFFFLNVADFAMDWPHFNGSNPCLDSQARNLHVTFFFFRVMDFKSVAERICGIVHYANYTVDFPFKWMGSGMQSDFDAELPCGISAQFCIKTYPKVLIVASKWLNGQDKRPHM